MWMGGLEISRLPESCQAVIILEVHPGVQGLHGPGGAVQTREAVDEVGAEGGVYVLRGELAHGGPVVGPGSPVADDLLVVAEDREISPDVSGGAEGTGQV